jgi:xanthine/uracil permease
VIGLLIELLVASMPPKVQIGCVVLIIGLGLAAFAIFYSLH